MIIFGLDPGPEKTGYVIMDADDTRKWVLQSGHVENTAIRSLIAREFISRFGLEEMASYGMPVGKSTFQTCEWIGRFGETLDLRRDRGHIHAYRFTRPEVQRYLCHSSRAKEAHVRQALIDRIGPPGTKKNPGPTYGVTGHAWSALAIAVLTADCSCPNTPCKVHS